jgi:hypothetical protein
VNELTDIDACSTCFLLNEVHQILEVVIQVFGLFNRVEEFNPGSLFLSFSRDALSLT